MSTTDQDVNIPIKFDINIFVYYLKLLPFVFE
jgi:hypothetical protein